MRPPPHQTQIVCHAIHVQAQGKEDEDWRGAAAAAADISTLYIQFAVPNMSLVISQRIIDPTNFPLSDSRRVISTGKTYTAYNVFFHRVLSVMLLLRSKKYRTTVLG